LAAQNTAVTTARLTIGRNEAIKLIKAQLERGLQIKQSKIRYVPELEKAREAKSTWTLETMDLLKRIFNNDAVADECQNWVGKVLPEYADLNLFIEHFYDEMDQRLRKLHAVLKQVQALPDDTAPRSINPHANAATAPVAIAPATGVVSAVTSPIAPDPDNPAFASTQVYTPPPAAAPAPSPEPRKSSRSHSQTQTSTHMNASTNNEYIPSSRGVAAYPDISAPAPAPTPAAKRGAGAVIVYDDDPSAQESIQQFVTKLGYELILVKDGGGRSSKNGGALVEKLDGSHRLDFGLILSKPNALPKAFDLGYCVGRLGLKRIFVLSAEGDKVFVDEHGLLHIPLDPADGWQLHLARQFKRAGLEVDLNRVF
jgi:hypothetical protein